MNRNNQQQHQNEPANAQPARDLEQERVEFERMMKRQSDASREYTRGKLLSA